jgi:hypothetical protein
MPAPRDQQQMPGGCGTSLAHSPCSIEGSGYYNGPTNSLSPGRKFLACQATIWKLRDSDNPFVTLRDVLKDHEVAPERNNLSEEGQAGAEPPGYQIPAVSGQVHLACLFYTGSGLTSQESLLLRPL